MDPYERQRFIDRWEKRRAGGKTRFILRMTVVYTLILLAVSLIFELIEGTVADFWANRVLSWRLPMYAVFGLGLGWYFWWMMERTYRRAKSEGTS